VQKVEFNNELDKNVIARAKNGTGKTASFVIPMINMVDEKKKHIQALVLLPTRELAFQTSKVIKDLSKYTEIETMVTTGGTNLRDDIMRLQKDIHIMVGTPGRILDLVSRGIADLSKCQMFVLDEADKLVSEDFQPVILRFLEHLNEDLQWVLISATFPTSVGKFLKRIPKVVKINLMKELTLKGITQYYAYIEERQKVHCLNTLFSKLKIQQAIIFCNSSLRVELLAKKIMELNYSCYFIHAKMP
jgi:ATP-dependent RNA helicase DDX6/DHH1